jgi:hypothetical protein
VTIVLLPVRRLIVIAWARVADLAATVARLSDPTTDRATTAIIADHLVHCIDGTTAGCVADDAATAVVVRLGLWDCNGEGADNGEDDDDYFFHGGELGFATSDERPQKLFESPSNIFHSDAVSRRCGPYLAKLSVAECDLVTLVQSGDARADRNVRIRQFSKDSSNITAPSDGCKTGPSSIQ